MMQHYIVKIESFEGRDIYLQCGDDNQDYMFAIIGIDSDRSAEILDSGYRSFDEAARAWPDAITAK